MSQNNPHQPLIAALVIDLLAKQDTPEGCNAHIFPDGKFRSDDGRPARDTEGRVQDWRMDAQIAADLIAQLEKSGKPILYDYEHNSLWGDSEAAGWITKLVYVAGKGMYARVEWVDDAAEAIAGKKYRYSSPCFLYDDTGRIVRLLSVALTNNPALGDLGAVALARQAALSATPVGALAALFSNAAGRIPGITTGDQAMTPEQIAALTTERDTLKTNVAALTAERDKAHADLAALRKQVDDAKAAADAAKRKDMIEAALTAGHLVPAQKEFAESLDLGSLTKFLDTLKPVAMLSKQVDGKGKPGGDKNAQLTAEEQAMCKSLGVSPEDFLLAKGN